MSPGASTASCCRREAAQDLERQPGLEREIVLAAVAPAAAAEALQQEHVVGIDVRADAAAGRGVAHHQVVEARVRQEREAAQQRVAGVGCEIDALHQQRPVARGQRAKSARRNGPCASDQRRAVAHDEARLDVVAPREREELASRVNRPAKPGIALRTSSGSFCQ